MRNLCTICYTDLGYSNPRQLCHKTFCPYDKYDSDNIDDINDKNYYINNNRISILKYNNKKYNNIIKKLIYKYKITTNINIIKLNKKYDKKIYKNYKLIVNY